MSNEVLTMLLQRKLTYVDTMTSAAMLWWVSSVVFCGYIISGIWTKRSEVIKLRAFHWFFFVIFVFFFSVVVFGGWIIYATNCLQHEAAQLLGLLNVSFRFLFEFTAIKYGTLIGTTSFVLVTVTWVSMWIYLAKEKKIEELKEETISNNVEL